MKTINIPLNDNTRREAVMAMWSFYRQHMPTDVLELVVSEFQKEINFRKLKQNLTNEKR